MDPIAIVINEFSASTAGTDVEFVEILSTPNTALTGYTLVEIEGDSGTAAGTIDSVIAIAGTTDGNGLLLFSLPANEIENGTITLLLVKDFTGAAGTDLDTDNDGTLDATPWAEIVDSIAVNDGGAGDLTYGGAPVLTVAYDGAPFAPGGASRVPDGADTDTAADWVRNDFDLAGIPGFIGTLVDGEAENTPGVLNAPPAPVLINEFSASTAGTDVEYIEIIASPNTTLSGYTLLQIEGDSGASAGTIDSVRAITGTTGANGLLLFSLPANTIENGTITLLLVKDFTGSVGTDLDTNNDGTLDATPWGEIIDAVAVNDGGAGDLTYAAVVLGQNYDGLSSFAPGGASRVPDGVNTGTASDWVRNDFDLAGITGFTGTPVEGEALNTPGAANALVGDGGGPGAGGATPATIMTIQGAGHTSPLVNQRVATTGIVTAVDSNGFYMQDPVGDGNIATSDGIFVFTGSRPTVAAGDAVTVTATVLEFARNSAAGHLTITQLGNGPEITVSSTGNALPAATLLGEGGRLPPTEIIDNDGFTTYDPTEDGVDFYESHEGMRVEIRDALVVAPSFNSAGNPGETWVVGDDGDFATNLNSRGGLTLTETDGNPERIQVQADTGILPSFTFSTNVGDSLGTVVGVMDYDSRGNYEVLATAAFTVTPGDLAREETTLEATADTLLVGTFNVENLDPSDTKFDLLAEQIVTAMNTPDIIALQEIQDNSGPDNDGVTDASLVYQALTEAIAEAGGPTYAFFDIAPANNTSGGAPGGNIRVGYLYNPERVALVEDSVAQVLDPNLADGNAWFDTRIPLRADFVFAGETVTIINNHWSSKGGSSPQFGSIQPLVNGSEDQRVAQAAVVYQYVADILAADANAAVMVLGDLNEFDWEDALDIVTGRAAGEQIMFNMFEEQFAEGERYEYVFDGNHQVLDHVLVTAALRPITVFDPIHVNSQWAVNDPGRSSDHDPAVAAISFGGDGAVLDLALFQTALFSGRPTTEWEGAAENLSYVDGTTDEAQDSASDDDSTGDTLGRFAEENGDVDVFGAAFANGVTLDGDDALVSLTWDDGAATLAHKAPWNAIKVLSITDFTGGALTIEGWVDVNVALGDSGTDLTLVIDGSKRGSIETGAGDDAIVIGADSNERVWSNLFAIDTGAGDDVVAITAASRAYAAESFARSFFDAFATATVRLGEGDDVLQGTGRDTARYDGPLSGYTITALAGGGIEVADSDLANGDEGTDLLFGVAFLTAGGTTYAVDSLIG
ncbi:endonuclease/exonuclease/phosphatase family protein [Elioraea sp.]|uniref:endonuclease/exonuclease/phosphatase family protein n=1 Tax=Elioraea sp. TaxID=2185103 RepID=UPI0025BED1DA|nr:endonuclease/exonuclease/phosphatase family protein [Elioraea sp.]